MLLFLMRFRQVVPVVSPDNEPPCVYSEDEQVSLFVDGTLAWRAKSKKPRTSCHTGSRLSKGRSSKSLGARVDKRAGK